MQFLLNLAAGQRIRQQTPGRYFMIVSADVDTPVQIDMWAGSRLLESITTARAGFKARMPADVAGGFTHVELQADVNVALQVVISDGLVDFDFFAGANVNATIVGPNPLPVQNDRGAPANPVYVSGITYSDAPATSLSDKAAVAVNDTADLIVAANANRKALRIANLGTDPVALGAAGITWAKRCIVLEAGDVWIEERGANLEWYAITNTGLSASVTAQEVLA